MKLFIAIIILTSLTLNEANSVDYDYYQDEPVYPNQEHRLCGSRHCENTCARPDAENFPCPFQLCHEGYFCEVGYVREIETDRCILPSDCPDTVEVVNSEERDAVFWAISEYDISDDYL